jgi:hypothetical protein
MESNGVKLHWVSETKSYQILCPWVRIKSEQYHLQVEPDEIPVVIGKGIRIGDTGIISTDRITGSRIFIPPGGMMTVSDEVVRATLDARNSLKKLSSSINKLSDEIDLPPLTKRLLNERHDR